MEPRAEGYRIVVVGASAGGLNALRTLVGGLGAGFELPLAIVQHRSKDSELLCELIQECTPLPVIEVLDKEEILPGHVYIAPADYHLLPEDGFFSLSTEAPVRFSRPSIDVTFETAALNYGADTIGVVLTGANSDGAQGLREIAGAGGHAVVQDPAEAEVRVMPLAALRAVPTACVQPIARIGPYLAAIHRRRTPPCTAEA